MKKMTKRIMAMGMAAVMASGMLTGCGGSKKASDELNIMVWDGTWDEEVFKDFEKEHILKPIWGEKSFSNDT